MSEMAAETAPIELPTGRRSYIAPAHESPDINNPKWIPVLSNVDLQKLSHHMEKGETPPTPTANYSPFPPRPFSPPKPKHHEYLHHKYSKSSLAPEAVPSELEAEPLPPRISSKKAVSPSPILADSSLPHLGHRSADAPSSDGQETVTSDHTADASATTSTVGTASLVEDQYYTLPDTSLTKEDIQPPQLMSGRSSVASTRIKSGAMPPTSKYNRKHTSSVPGRPATIKSEPVTPDDSPRMSPQPPSPVAIPVSEPLPSPQVPFPTQAPPVPDTGSNLQESKSTGSERRLRALNSHPSNLSQSSQAGSRPGSTSDEDGIVPKPPSVRHRPRKSTDSRPGTSRSTIYDGQTPTPAPTTPLPQLPPEARTRPATRESPTYKPTIQLPPEAHVASHIASTNAVESLDHARITSFMTTRSQIVFRRFDDVHVKLLLCLQDEIAQLEQELSVLETGSPTTGSVTLQKVRLMQELRRVVAEYDHLFASWSSMKAKQADQAVVRDLRQCLENPNTKAGAGLGGARKDLAWLENSKDLSSINLRDSEKPVKRERAASQGGEKSSGGGFAGLFNCVGKRK